MLNGVSSRLLILLVVKKTELEEKRLTIHEKQAQALPILLNDKIKQITASKRRM